MNNCAELNAEILRLCGIDASRCTEATITLRLNQPPRITVTMIVLSPRDGKWTMLEPGEEVPT